MSDWYCLKCDTSSPYLCDLFQYARTHYIHHTDWYIKHRDAGFKTLAAALTAEFAIVGFAFSAYDIPRMLAIVALLAISLISIPLTHLARLSCTQSYKASMEHAAFITKIVWAMGLCSAVPISVKECDEKACPLSNDPTFYVPRYIDDAYKYTTTKDFVEWNLSKKGSTLFATKTTLALMGGTAALFGIASSVAVMVLK